MATTFFNLFTRPYNDVGAANFVKVVLYKTTSPLAEFTSQTSEDPGPLDASTWSFPGLDTTNYICKIFEVTADDDVVRQIEGDFTFIPSSSKFDYKPAVFIEIGVTEIPGLEPAVFPDGVNTVTVPDWIGWRPIITKIGVGAMMEDVQYAFNQATGKWDLLIVADVFELNTFYMVQFEPIISLEESVSQYNTPFSEVMVITATTTLTAADIGKKILVKSATSYLEITLPDISTVVENRIAFFEFCQGTLKCCKIKTFSGDIIDWQKKGVSDRNAVYGCPDENLQLFKEVVDVDTSVWRVHQSDGNFKTVGNRVAEDQISTGVINKLLLDGAGTTGVSSDDYARLYYDYVSFLPASQVVSYANWATGNNKYLYSTKDATTGKFHVPDLRDKFMRNSGITRTAGNLQLEEVGPHAHPASSSDTAILFIKRKIGLIGGLLGLNSVTGGYEFSEQNTGTNSGLENRPNNVAENYYVIV